MNKLIIAAVLLLSFPANAASVGSADPANEIAVSQLGSLLGIEAVAVVACDGVTVNQDAHSVIVGQINPSDNQTLDDSDNKEIDAKILDTKALLEKRINHIGKKAWCAEVTKAFGPKSDAPFLNIKEH